jgi:hypothetical protein
MRHKSVGVVRLQLDRLVVVPDCAVIRAIVIVGNAPVTQRNGGSERPSALDETPKTSMQSVKDTNDQSRFDGPAPPSEPYIGYLKGF